MNRWARTLADAWRRRAPQRTAALCVPPATSADPVAQYRRSEAFAEDLSELLTAAPQVLKQKTRRLSRSLR